MRHFEVDVKIQWTPHCANMATNWVAKHGYEDMSLDNWEASPPYSLALLLQADSFM